MIQETIKDVTPRMRSLELAQFDNVQDLSRYVKNAKRKERFVDAKWAGGTMAEYHKRSYDGDDKYMNRADQFVEQFSNIALSDYDVDLDYNTQYGVLDYQAAMIGDPACLFGPTMMETERAPVNIYVDTWTSCTIATSAMTMRGVAVLALVRALSVFRPVIVKVTSGMHHRPSRKNIIMTMPIPTAPMDISIASWALGSPQSFRCGFLGAVYEVADDGRSCGIPRLDDVTWQSREMGNWLAARDGVNDVVHLPFMMDNGQWRSEDYCLRWVQSQLARFAPQPN